MDSDAVPDRKAGEPLRKYWLRVMAVAPDEATVKLDEFNDQLVVLDWPDGDDG
jgi:hypothetical protein